MKPRDLTALVRHAEDEQTARHLETLLQDSANVRVHGTVLKEKTVMELHLFGYRFRLQRNCAPAALDTLYDIFIGREHQLAPGFAVWTHGPSSTWARTRGTTFSSSNG